jgi:hypothetical protein
MSEFKYVTAMAMQKPKIRFDARVGGFVCASFVRVYLVSGRGPTPGLAWSDWAKEIARFLLDEAAVVKGESK